MKSSFETADELRESRDKEFLEQFKVDRPLIVYTITSLYTENPDVGGDDVPIRKLLPRRNRLVGFYKTLEKAKQCVEEDWAGFDEAGYYNYIVIEGLWEGCYPGLGDYEWWYKHDFETRKWVPCERPKAFSGLVNFYG